MNREIKFRGMCANGVMRYGRLSQDRPGATRYYNEYSQRICWDSSNIPVSNKSLGQFTGLHDKNGKEIYEGDIVTTLAGVRAVIYGAPSFFLAKDPEDEFDVDEMFTPFTDEEVIGNIHENPELLT